MTPVDTEQHGEFTISYYHDQDCGSPIEHNEGVHITYAARSHYTLGNDKVDIEEHESIGQRIAAGELIGLPVYAYIHSGIALSTRSFGDPWDSGQSGYIYVTRKTALEWQGGKVLTKKRRENVLKSLRAFVKEFGAYLNGECYGFEITHGGEHVDSCWGFIGFECVREEARAALNHAMESVTTKKRKAWRAALHEARERKHWAARDVQTKG